MMSVLVMLALAVPAGADSPPSGVEIVVPGFEGPFTASGPAVDDGILCATGTAVNGDVRGAGFQSNRLFNLTVFKEFTCDDASGSFVLKLQVQVNSVRGTSFNWVVVSGTGEYVDLHGRGRGFVAPVDTDIYQGGVHIDP
jgi:hypothetical protein